MHALDMYLGVLENQPLPKAPLALVHSAQKCTRIMDEMFSRFLDISRLDIDAIVPNRTVFPIQQLLDQLRVEFEQPASQKGLQLKLQPCSLFVFSDLQLLGNVLRNLVANAIKYTHQGQVLIGCRRRGASLQVQVIDTGVGIPAEELALIYEEFYQVDNLARDRTRGLGLGLAIVQRLSALLGLGIQCHSTVGKGTVFSMWVPRTVKGPAVTQDPAQGQPITAMPAIEDQTTMRTHPARIWLIDDDLEVLRAMQIVLKHAGYQVITAASYQAVQALLVRAMQMPDLIVCDYRLPGSQHGFDVIQLLRDEFAQDIPALLITGDTTSGLSNAISQPKLRVLYKPLQPDALHAAIMAMLQND